ncbi:MAG: S8 family serine peptidase [Ruminococcus sp.]|nr:S8 family serine peptidase [Ruminococcus sp.]
MSIKNRMISALLALVLTLSFTTAVNAVDTDQGDTVFENEALSSYPLGHMSWGVSHMGLDKLQKKLENSGKPLPEVRVAVIDSGINTSNPFLKGRYTDDGYNFISNSTDITDEEYHGTTVSGRIADATSSNVKVLPIKVNGKDGKGNMKNVSKGIYYAIEHGADVINLSLSSEDPNHSLTILDEAIEAAVSRGIAVTVASGNQKGDIKYRYPANKDNVLTITSIDSSDMIGENANTGEGVDFALPGVMILAPYKREMFFSTGTSLAAPHAAAAAALLKTWDKSLTQSEIKDIFIKYSVDLGDKGYDTTYGWGMIDLGGFDIDSEVKPTHEPTQPVTEASTDAPTQPATHEPTVSPTQPATDETVAPTQVAALLGDADRDGDVTSADAAAVQRAIVKMAVPSLDMIAADTDGDGELTVTDATFIQRWLIKAECPYGIGEPMV